MQSYLLLTYIWSAALFWKLTLSVEKYHLKWTYCSACPLRVKSQKKNIVSAFSCAQLGDTTLKKKYRTSALCIVQDWLLSFCKIVEGYNCRRYGGGFPGPSKMGWWGLYHHKPSPHLIKICLKANERHIPSFMPHKQCSWVALEQGLKDVPDCFNFPGLLTFIWKKLIWRWHLCMCWLARNILDGNSCGARDINSFSEFFWLLASL